MRRPSLWILVLLSWTAAHAEPYLAVRSGLSCSASCGGADASCAECINDHSCGEILPRCGGNGFGVCAGWSINPK